MSPISLEHIQSFLDKHGIAPPLKAIRRGIEKESLRITQQGQLSQRPHPKQLGSALCHPQITTDYSEALIELITGVHDDIDSCLQELRDIHQFTYQELLAHQELLWTSSMPCFIAEAKDIPIAQYGSSCIGKMKHIYRIGLDHRYGRLMQTIAGVHYNFSLSDDFWRAYQCALDDKQILTDFKTQQYFHLIRNFQRHAWLLIYLFSASPSICPSFVKDRTHNLQLLDNGDLGMPFGMCLRMGDLGYQSSAQDAIKAQYNDHRCYIRSLLKALLTPHQTYADIGLKDDQGEYLQLSTHLLQIENEFYSIIRPKTVTRSGETPLNALADRGVEYIEVRCIDLNPFSEIGIEKSQIEFIDCFLLYCLFSPSPQMQASELKTALDDFKHVANNGLTPNITLHHGETLSSSAHKLLDAIYQMSQNIGAQEDTLQSIRTQKAKVAQPELTLAGTMRQQMQARKQQHFYHWGLQQSQQHASMFSATKTPNPEFVKRSQQSLIDQCQLEEEECTSFDDFLANYYQQYQVLAEKYVRE